VTDIALVDLNESPFNKIRHDDENGEFWLARELAPLLGYSTSDSWKNFVGVIERARADMINIGQDPDANASKIKSDMSDSISLTPRSIDDYRLSRYGCFMTAMNGDYRKPEISAARFYFADRTRRYEIYQEMTDREKAVMLARQVVELDEQLNEAMQELAIAMPKVEEWEEIINSNELYDWYEVAGLLYNDQTERGRGRLLKVLRELGVIFPVGIAQRAQPKAKYLKKNNGLGWFEMITPRHLGGKSQTCTTRLGVSELFKFLKDHGEDVINPNENF